MKTSKVYGFVTVPEGAPAMNVHRYETASAYDTLVPTPGTYPVVGDSVAGMVRCDIPATRVEHYYESRLLSATSVDHRMGLDIPDTYVWQAYAFQIRKPLTTSVGTFEPVGATPPPEEAA